MLRSSLIITVMLVITSITASAKSTEDTRVERQQINQTLDALHRHASTADWNEYFNLYSDDAIFIGTDVTERWDIITFRKYAIKAKNGWTYRPTERHIAITPEGKAAWFDEILDSENYGTSRGTGTLIKTDKGWKIAQYHLTFPIPNDLAKGITDKIKEYEKIQQAQIKTRQ